MLIFQISLFTPLHQGNELWDTIVFGPKRERADDRWDTVVFGPTALHATMDGNELGRVHRGCKSL